MNCMRALALAFTLPAVVGWAPFPLLAQDAPASQAALRSAAQSAAPWFGLPLPGPATDQAVDFKSMDLQMLPAAAPRDAAELDGRKALRHVDAIVRFAYASRDAGERTWGRIAGSRWTEAAVDYVAEQLREAGVADVVKREVPFAGTEAIATDWSVRLIGAPAFGAGTRDVELRSAFPMGVGPEGAGMAPGAGLDAPAPKLKARAPIVYLGEGEAADIATHEVRGRIAVLRMQAAPAMFYSASIRAAQQLAAAGAAAVLVIYDTPGNMQVRFGACQNIPCFALGGEDGEFLVAAITRAAGANVLSQLQMDLSVDFEGRPVKRGHMLVGRIKGVDSSQNLIVNAHSDSYFAGANDNASGMAALIALARHYARGPKPKHDIYFVLSPGHHSPTGGTRGFVELYPEVPPANIIAVNLEHIGQQGSYRSYFGTRGMGGSPTKYGNREKRWIPTNGDSPGRELSGAPLTPKVREIIAKAALDSGFVTLGRINESDVGELAGLVKAGATGIQSVETSIWYHTSGDTPDTVSPDTLQRGMLFYRSILDQAATVDRAQIRAGMKPSSTGDPR